MRKGVHISRGKSGWFWHAVAGNGKIVANGEVYSSRKSAMKGMEAAYRILNEFKYRRLPLFINA